MEVKIWMDGYQRTVCGITDQTTCQDVIVTLAQASGMTGRYAMYERWKTMERRLPPTERPVLVLERWGEHSNDVQLLIRRFGPTGDRKKLLSPNRADSPSERSVLSGGAALKKSLTFTGAHRRSRSMDQSCDSRVGGRDYSRNVGSLGRSSVASRSSKTPSPRASLERPDVVGESGIYHRLSTRRLLSATEWKQTSAAATAGQFPKVPENVAVLESPGIKRGIFQVNNPQSKYVVGAGGADGVGASGGGGGGRSSGAGRAFCTGGGAGSGGAVGNGGSDVGSAIKKQVSISKTIADRQLSSNGTKLIPTNDKADDVLSRTNSSVSITRTISNRSTSNSLPSSPAMNHSSDRLKQRLKNTNRNMNHITEKASTSQTKSVNLSNSCCPINDKNVTEVVNKTKIREFEIKDTKHRRLQRTALDLLYPTITATKTSVQDVNFCNNLRNCLATDVSNTSYKVPSMVSGELNPARSVESFAEPDHLGIAEKETVLREERQRMALMEMINAQDRELLDCKSRLSQLNYEILLLEDDSPEVDEKLNELDSLSVEAKLETERERESKLQTEELKRLSTELLQANVESQLLTKELASVEQEIGIADRCLSRRREDLAGLERQLKGFNLDVFLKRHIRATTYKRGLPSVVVSTKALPSLQWIH